MKLARVVLELSVPRRHWNRRRFRRHILEREVGQDTEAHFQRISNAVRRASHAKANIVVLPAYTLLGEAGGAGLSRWRQLPRRFQFDYLFGGILTRERRPPRNADLWREESIFAASKEAMLVPPNQYGPLPLTLGESPAIAAISSSVIAVRRFPEVFRSVVRQATSISPLLILDMGHNQYGSRYRRRLACVTTAAQDLGAPETLTLVSTWRWRDSSSGNWAFSNKQDAICEKRLQVPVEDGRTDFVDLFNV